MMQIDHLRCEYLANPLGIDVARPRLSWQLKSNRQGARQTAYQALAASSTAGLDQDKGALWDSGKVASDQSIHVPYNGLGLTSAQRVYWKVRAWDEQDQPTAWSETAWWEMGLLQRSDWKAEWIGSALVGSNRASVPVPFLRKEIALEKPVVSARLYVTALGLYEFTINGKRAGEDVFTPGWTDYRKRVRYQVYDVTGLLASGANALCAILGDGWYCGNVAWRGRQNWGDRPKLLAQLTLTFADGSTCLVATDSTWKTAAGPIVESDFQTGESYDARLELTGWDRPAYDDSTWTPVQVFPDPGAALSAMRGPGVRRQEELKPIAPPQRIARYPLDSWLYDLGQNMVGWVRLKLSGPAGTTVRLRFAEILDEKGEIYTANLRSARATDYYTLKGEGEEVYEPRFTFHGFRYVQVDNFPGAPDEDAITGVVVHSDMPQIGEFECSDPLVNQLQHNIRWGQKGNFIDVPTDCPQRDERLGWTGDAQVFVRTAAFNLDVAGFMTKWQQDLADAQSDYGQIPMYAPNPEITGNSRDGGPAWADAVMIIPWTMYLCYGDERLLEEHYPAFERYLEYLVRNSVGLIRCHPDAKWEPYGWQGFGDWLSIHAETPHELLGTAFLAYSARLMSFFARRLGKTADAARYQKLFEDTRAAFNHRFVTPGGLVAPGTQTAYVLALHFDLLPEELRAAAAQELARDIQNRKTHLSTGFVGSPYLPHVLTHNGLLDLQYRLLLQKSWPSWLYAVTQGATTIWERWDGWTEDKGFQDPGMNSFNHYAYGAIGAWLYNTVAGIEVDPDAPGYKRILFRPQIGGGLTHASASLQSMYGRVSSAWTLDGDRLTWEVAAPPNTTALAYAPVKPGQAVQVANADGAPAAAILITQQNGFSVLEIPSGVYRITVA